jgi:hypothetical protein
MYTDIEVNILTKMGDFMKTLQKYANMTFLLLSVATIVPAYANPTIVEHAKSITGHIVQYIKGHPIRTLASYYVLSATAVSTDRLLKNNRPLEGLLEGSIGITLAAVILLHGLDKD